MVQLYPQVHSVLTDVRHFPGDHIQPQMSQQLYHRDTKGISCGNRWPGEILFSLSCWKKICLATTTSTSCGKWLCFYIHREKSTQLFPTLCIALVLLVLAGFFSLCSWLKTSLHQESRNTTCSLTMAKTTSCGFGAGLEEVKSMAFSAELGGEFAKNECLAGTGKVCEGLPKQFTVMQTQNIDISFSFIS